jgi:hypothetical protein
VPSYVKEKRFQNWLENARDWVSQGLGTVWRAAGQQGCRAGGPARSESIAVAWRRRSALLDLMRSCLGPCLSWSSARIAGPAPLDPPHLPNPSPAPKPSALRAQAISRSRFWGTPIPIWASDDLEELVVVGSVEELEALTGHKVGGGGLRGQGQGRGAASG